MIHIKIPPPLIALLAGILIWAVNNAFPAFGQDVAVLKTVALVIALIGIFIEIWSVFLFIKKRTTVNPLKPQNSKKLVTVGLYRYSRNPMYLGMLLLLTGVVFWIGNPIGATILLLFVWYMTNFQIKPEEKALENLFGSQFREYKKQVRRWL